MKTKEIWGWWTQATKASWKKKEWSKRKYKIWFQKENTVAVMDTGIIKAEVVQGTKLEIKGKTIIITIMDTKRVIVGLTKEAQLQEATPKNMKTCITKEIQGFIQREIHFKEFKTRSLDKDLHMQQLKKWMKSDNISISVPISIKALLVFQLGI